MNRYILYKNGQIKTILLSIRQQLKQRLYSSSSSSSSSDDDKKKHELKKSNEALAKLNNLLNTMIQEDVDSKKMKLNLARPTDKRKKNRNESQESKSTEYESNDKRLKNAVKNVAKSLGGDVKQTESELLMKLLNGSDEKATTNLSELVKGMKIDNEQSATEQSKAQQVRHILQKKSEGKYFPKKFQSQPSESWEKVDLFGSKPLGIFQNQVSDMSEGTENKTWNKLVERDLKLAVTHPPSNYFQQMILWTEEGKVWKFPINNEQGLDEEKKIYFAEHVFLDKYLEPWCPPKGPLRHFMELVCVGLSKNPYLTVEAKKEHIMWFKNYFEEKKQLLKETGVIQDLDSSSKEDSPKQIE